MINQLLKIKTGTITKVISGGSNGSILVFDIVSDKLEYVLFIYCSWRLSHGKKVLASSADRDSYFVPKIQKLMNLKISNISIGALGDFAIRFNDKKLDVFCDSVYHQEDKEEWENWTLCQLSNNQCFVFTNNFDFKTEPYKE